MKVGSRRVAGIAGKSNDLAGRNRSPLLHADIREVGIEGREAVWVLDKHPLPVLAIWYRTVINREYGPYKRGANRSADERAKVYAGVRSRNVEPLRGRGLAELLRDKHGVERPSQHPLACGRDTTRVKHVLKLRFKFKQRGLKGGLFGFFSRYDFLIRAFLIFRIGEELLLRRFLEVNRFLLQRKLVVERDESRLHCGYLVPIRREFCAHCAQVVDVVCERPIKLPSAVGRLPRIAERA